MAAAGGNAEVRVTCTFITNYLEPVFVSAIIVLPSVLYHARLTWAEPLSPVTEHVNTVFSFSLFTAVVLGLTVKSNEEAATHTRQSTTPHTLNYYSNYRH